MKRIFSLLAVTALMVAMLLASAMPAFAAPKNETAPNCERGNNTAFGRGSYSRTDQATDSINKVYFDKCLA